MELTIEQLEALKTALAEDSKQIRDVFNENLQNTYSNSLIRRLTIQAQISKKVFVPQLMYIPFNPYTGKSDEQYNMARKWVTAKSPDLVMASLKYECSKDPALKEAYMRSAGYKDEWNTDDLTRIDTSADKAILWIYRRPMAYTFPVTSISSPQITGSDYGQTVLLGSEQDPDTGSFKGELSFLHLLASLVGALAQKEVKSFTDALKNNTTDNLCKKMGRNFTGNDDYLKMSGESQEAKDRKREIRNYYPMSSPYSAITMPVLAFDMTPRSGELFVHDDKSDTHELLDHFKNSADIDTEKFLYYNGTQGIREEVDNICGNYFPRNPTKIKERNKDKDLYPNWVVLDFVLNDTRTELTKEEKFDLSKRLAFKQEGQPMYDTRKKEWLAPELEEFIKNLNVFFVIAEDRDFIRTIKSWISAEYTQPNSAMEEAATGYLRSFLHPSLPVYDSSIKIKYNEILGEIFPEEQGTFAFKNQDLIAEKGEELMNELLNEGSVNEGAPADEEEDESFEAVEA